MLPKIYSLLYFIINIKGMLTLVSVVVVVQTSRNIEITVSSNDAHSSLTTINGMLEKMS